MTDATDIPGGYCWTEYGGVAYAVWSPKGELIAVVGLATERALAAVRDRGVPEAWRRGGWRTAEHHERALRGRKATHRAWAERIVAALNETDTRTPAAPTGPTTPGPTPDAHASTSRTRRDAAGRPDAEEGER